MKKRNVIILKGVSGSGKSTFATLFPNAVICCADDYFTDENGNYNFDQTKIGHAHAACRDKFDEALEDESIENIVVANTNTRPSDYTYYENMANKMNVRVFHIVMENRHGNVDVHQVPTDVIKRQYETLRANIKLI